MKLLKRYLSRILAGLTGLVGEGLVLSMSAILLIGLTLGLAAYLFLNTAAPRTLTLASGPPGSSFQRTAEKYQTILAREGVTLKILPSEGSSDNLKKLASPKLHVDVGFVLGGEARETQYEKLMSLGSIAFQPLMIFYVGEPRTLLSEFKGKRLNIGVDGSGTHTLALKLLKANGIVPGEDTTLDSTDLDDPGKELREGRVDAVFLMSDSTATTVTRTLMRDSSVRLFSFVQADAYVRRISTLTKLQLPRGTLDFGKDIPPQDIELIGPTVQLVARDTLHPALSDLLLEAAREVHGPAGIYRKRGEFPAPHEGEFRGSPDAARYFTSGKSFLYRSLPFWLATLVARVLAVLVPVILLLIPALRIAPAIYRWRVESRIYRWYRALLELERRAFDTDVGAEQRAELLQQLDQIEAAVNRIVIPAAFGDLFYGLRGHIGFVRARLRLEEVTPRPDLPVATEASARKM